MKSKTKKIPIVYQGETGAYTHQAIFEFGKLHKISFDPKAKRNFREMFEAVAKKEGLGLVPIENSTAGSVVQCYDLFFEYDVEIIGEYKMPVQHCLLGVKGTQLKQVRRVYSHPQALSQCSNFIEKKKWDAHSVLDTAGGAREVAEKKEHSSVAIASSIAAKNYGLQILKENFQNTMKNTTRFLLIKKKGKRFSFEKKLGQPNKTSLLFETRHIPAALYKALGGFATNGINLSKLESRPKKNGKTFEPIFFVDAESERDDQSMRLALEELRFYSKKVKVLGSYKKH